MSRRSPTNERYQKFTEPKGQTRKSAAAAKPVRKEGSGAAAKAKPKPKAEQPGGKFYEPDTPEYKFWRRVWWYCLGIGLAFVGVSFYLQYAMKGVSWSRQAGLVTLAICYALIIGAFFVDYRKLRPMRKGTYVAKDTVDSK
jgi:hypothetical protein